MSRGPARIAATGATKCLYILQGRMRRLVQRTYPLLCTQYSRLARPGGPDLSRTPHVWMLGCCMSRCFFVLGQLPSSIVCMPLLARAHPLFRSHTTNGDVQEVGSDSRRSMGTPFKAQERGRFFFVALGGRRKEAKEERNENGRRRQEGNKGNESERGMHYQAM